VRQFRHFDAKRKIARAERVATARALYTLNSLHTGEVDGFLNGVVTVREGNARGMLRIEPASNPTTAPAMPRALAREARST
jgi:hypothetical protein